VTPENQGEGGGSEDIRVRAAAALWSTRCATCHGADGRGDGPGRPPGAPMPDFTQPSFHAERTDAQLAQVIANGRGLMPGFGDQFTDAGLAALVEHVRGLRAGE
jgi:mono/diheme cytochrome c family protein